MKNSKNPDKSNSSYTHLYGDPSTENLDSSELADYLRGKSIFRKIEVRESLVKNYSGSIEDLAEKFARARVRNLEAPKADFEPLLGEIRFEEELVQNPAKKVSGILYDGPSLMRVFSELLPEDEKNLSHLHVIYTNRLFGTWDQSDHRYHARVSIYGFPSIISTTGIVEAPAKPKEFYQLKRRYAARGQSIPIEDLKKKFQDRFIDYDDERLTEVMKGYLMQAVFHYFTSNPFCDDENCRLFNAHWQEEVLKAQLTKPEFCLEHEKTIEEWKKRFSS
ncbi:hypothetical protein AKJ35_00575 [candidate division MSBL1 archaeon SCGC-AAA833F18]|uniref:Uncharacterized protein n=2 Tax=candidate division MSBL1 TaxID=215777 RepID=A0A133VT65_9EURY|nr:hypothetical protein AKJ47_02335 [candidate division MSBL1 archaeon SCGC-AAA261G05]KXB09633.1 hypothetical protein AKJ35_00575 [candidate division MSBL1 archaeon SCGC-AAA833F18]